jgi:hypothetical protein
MLLLMLAKRIQPPVPGAKETPPKAGPNACLLAHVLILQSSCSARAVSQSVESLCTRTAALHTHLLNNTTHTHFSLRFLLL